MHFRKRASTRSADRAAQFRRRQLRLIALLATLLLAGGTGAVAGVTEREEPVPGTRRGTEQRGNGCGADQPDERWICPAPDEESARYIDRIFSDAPGNGIAVWFSTDGLALANNCQGSEELATMVAELFARIPANERVEEDIVWAIPKMTGEIRGHALAYRTAVTDSIRNRANPVNIVFPEYRGDFPGGVSGITNRAQQLLWDTLC